MPTITGKTLAHPYMGKRTLDSTDQRHLDLAHANTSVLRDKITQEITGNRFYTMAQADDAWSCAMFLLECDRNGWIL